MCGLAGILGDQWRPSDLRKMLQAQEYRGPDDWGIELLGPCGLANNRLSILDLTARGHQPMYSADGKLCISYNGEVYNAPELRQELDAYPFRTETDTEVVLAAFQKWGDECVKRFIGQFAIAIWDKEEKCLFLARDRLGIKPLYYAWHNGNFYFASEIKALLAAGVPAIPDEETWAVYLSHGIYDHSPRTFFKGVYALKAGYTAGVFQDTGMFKHGYWELEQDEPLDLWDDAAAEQLLGLLQESLRLCLRSDVPVGLNLSEGLDSNSLYELLCRGLGATDVALFLMHDRASLYDNESGIAEVFWQSLPEVMYHQEAPFGGLATVAYHRLHQTIRDVGCKVTLEGQGADEILAGYDYYRNPPDPELYQDGTRHLRRECISPEIHRLAGPVPEFPSPFNSPLDNAMYQDLRYKKLPRVLRMNDKLAMASGVELREPYLDHRLVEFCFRLPEQQKIRGGLGKWLLRYAMRGKLPNAMRLAPKKGDVTPQREWLRGPLRPYVEEVIYSREFKERGLFNVKECQKAYKEFCKQGGENSFWVWQWVNVHLFWEQFVRCKAS